MPENRKSILSGKVGFTLVVNGTVRSLSFFRLSCEALISVNALLQSESFLTIKSSKPSFVAL
jgi:hypothetical protein